MNKIIFISCCMAVLFSACKKHFNPSTQSLNFTSSNTELTQTFNWAKKTALSFVGPSTDKSGPWYEAALPAREAFCMRDVSHQSSAAEYLGLHEQNLNMMKLFAQNISESKDWCSYWEINRYNKPAPVDYRNDQEFWYNLPANFDVIQACYNIYLISGDETYIKDSVFLNFYQKSVNEYINQWQLNPDELSSRNRYLNLSENANLSDPFSYARGLPSYIESANNLQLGADLIASLYGGFLAYSKICKANNQTELAEQYLDKAYKYKEILDNNWWDEKFQDYYTYRTKENEYHHSEPSTFMLWFNAVSDKNRIKNILNHLSAKKYNIENTSYLPYLFYKHGRKQEAYNQLMYLSSPQTPRRDYPEVSFGVIQGIIEGLMGIHTNSEENYLSIKANLTDKTKWVKIENFEALSTIVSIKHQGCHKTTVKNTGDMPISCKISFDTSYNQILVNNKNTKVKSDSTNNEIYCIINCKPGESAEVMAKILKNNYHETEINK